MESAIGRREGLMLSILVSVSNNQLIITGTSASLPEVAQQHRRTCNSDRPCARMMKAMTMGMQETALQGEEDGGTESPTGERIY
jgi:hypothetical protein